MEAGLFCKLIGNRNQIGRSRRYQQIGWWLFFLFFDEGSKEMLFSQCEFKRQCCMMRIDGIIEKLASSTNTVMKV